MLYASVYGTLFFLAQFQQTAQGYRPLDAGLRLLPWTATLFVVAPIAGALVSRIGERPLIVGGLLLQAIGLMIYDRPQLSHRMCESAHLGATGIIIRVAITFALTYTVRVTAALAFPTSSSQNDMHKSMKEKHL